MLEDILLNLAAGLAQTLFELIAEDTAHRLADPQRDALERAYSDALAATLRPLSVDLRDAAGEESQADLETVGSVLRDYVRQPAARAALLAVALHDQPLDLDRMQTHFRTVDGPARLRSLHFGTRRQPFDLAATLTRFEQSLRAAIDTAAATDDSPLHNWWTVGVIRDIQTNIRDLKAQLADQYAARPYRPPIDIPPPVPHFTDREHQLAALLRDLRPGRVLTLAGPGGIGKTALAAQAVRALAQQEDLVARFPDGILFHSFYQQPTAAQAYQYIAAMYDQTDEKDPYLAARRALAGRTALLILDGAEDADDLDAVLALQGTCAVLITSRDRSQAHDAIEDLTPLPPIDAARLLQDWAGDWAADNAAVAAICDLVGQLPLALRLVGSALSVDQLTAPEYLKDVLAPTGLAALTRGERQRDSVPLLLARTVANLPAAAQDVLAVVGALAYARFDRALIAAALDLTPAAALAALGHLTRYSLLTRTDHTYIVTHRLIHTHARQHLTPTPDTLHRLVRHLIAHINAHAADFPALDAVRPHVRLILDLCVAREQWQDVADLAFAVEDYLDLQGYYADRHAVTSAGLVAARAQQDRRGESIWLNNLGLASVALGRVEEAIGYYEQALAVSREIGERHGESVHLGNLGNVTEDLGRLEEAMGYYEQALAISRAIDDRSGESAHLGNLGNVSESLGRMQEAIEYYVQALAISRAIDDRRDEGKHLGNLGIAYRNLGRVREAIGYCAQALAISREIGDRHGESVWLANLGNASADLGHMEEAIGYYEQAFAISREIGDRRGEGADLGNLGNASAALGRMEEAIGYYEQALAISREIGDRSGQGTNLGNLGNAHRMLGRVEEANGYYAQALDISRETGDRRGEGIHLANIGMVHKQIGDAAEAHRLWQQAHAIFTDIKSPYAATVQQWLNDL